MGIREKKLCNGHYKSLVMRLSYSLFPELGELPDTHTVNKAITAKTCKEYYSLNREKLGKQRRARDTAYYMKKKGDLFEFGLRSQSGIYCQKDFLEYHHYCNDFPRNVTACCHTRHESFKKSFLEVGIKLVLHNKKTPRYEHLIITNQNLTEYGRYTNECI